MLFFKSLYLFSNDKKKLCSFLICTKCWCNFHLSGCLHNNGCVMTEKASFLCSFDLHVIFARFLSHDARITPSKTNKNISKI